MGKLISIGCSYTDHDYFNLVYKEKRPSNHLFWDELLAKELDLELHNYGKSGAGSDRHVFDAAQAIAKHGKDIKAIVVGWSIWDRFSYPYSSGIQNICPPEMYAQIHKGHDYSGFANAQKYSGPAVLKCCLLSTFAHMYTIAKLADSIDAKLLVVQMLNPINTHLKNTEKRNMFDDHHGPSQHEIIYDVTEENPTFKMLENDNRFSGFPYMQRLGGNHIWSIKLRSQSNIMQINRYIKNMKWVRWEHDKMYIDETKTEQRLDNHPNHNGQRFIYEKILERWNEIYK